MRLQGLELEAGARIANATEAPDTSKKPVTENSLTQMHSFLNRFVAKLLVCQTLVFIAFRLRAEAGPSQEFSVAGSYTCTTYGKTTNVVVLRQAGGFRVHVRDCHWNILMQGTGEKAVIEVGNDDRGDVMMVIRIDPSVPQATGSKMAQEVGLMEPFIHPFGLGRSQLPMIWWAFASACHLQTNGTSRVRPLLLHEAEALELFYWDHQVKADVQLLSLPPGLPRVSHFVEDGFVRKWGREEAARAGFPPDRRPRPGRFAKGFTNVVYETQQVTNLNGLELPLSATLKEFGHKPFMVLGADLSLRQFIQLSVTNVALSVPRGSTVPAITRLITITDNRFALAPDRVPLVHFDTGTIQHQFPSRTESKNSPAYQQAMMEVDIRRSGVRADLEKQAVQRARGSWILAAVTAPILVYLVVVGTRFAKRAARRQGSR